ncbi:MAG: hypothetical protein EA338_12665 [Roseinatronobacter sp.]|nr:MAG: hypothetical protein EA338_12665 [Roseinatronobacter sp.]
MRSDEPNKKSSAGQERPDGASVFDFLYADDARISALLSQFNNFGHLVGIDKSQTASRSAGSGFGTSGKVNFAIASGNGDWRTDENKEATESSIQRYDPRWANTLNLLDELQSRELIADDVASAPLGSFVYVKGDLTIRDLGLIKKFWGLKNFSKLTGLGGAPKNRKDRRATDATGGSPETPLEAILELMTVLPHSVQATMEINGQSVWASLHHDALTVSTDDLLLKYGTRLSGTWGMLGILDTHAVELGNAHLSSNKTGGELVAALDQFVPMLRGLLGRPDDSFGLTPLVIMRPTS